MPKSRHRSDEQRDLLHQPGQFAIGKLAEIMKAKRFTYKLIQLERFQDTFQAFLAGRCDAAIAGAADLAGAQVMLAPNPADFLVLDTLMSDDPYSLYVARGDWEWFAIVRWVHYGLVEAERRGITQSTCAELARVPRRQRQANARRSGRPRQAARPQQGLAAGSFKPSATTVKSSTVISARTPGSRWHAVSMRSPETVALCTHRLSTDKVCAIYG